MIKRVILFGIGMLTVILGCLMVARSETLYGTPNAVYISTAGGGCRTLIPTGYYLAVFTTGGVGSQAYITGANYGQTAGKLWGTGNCSVGAKPIHFHG